MIKVFFKDIKQIFMIELILAKSLHREIGNLLDEQLSLPLEDKYDDEFKAYDKIIKSKKIQFNQISSSQIIVNLIQNEIGDNKNNIYDLAKIKISRELHNIIHDFNLKLISLREIYSKEGLEKLVAIQEFALGFDIVDNIEDVNEIHLYKNFIMEGKE